MIVTAGSANVSVYYYIVQDASATSPGEPVTGLLFSDIETGGSASYARQGAIRTDLTLITLASASAAHSDGGFILVDDTNMPGLYRCDYPDAAFATGVDQVFLQIVVAAANNAVAAPILVDITDVDLRDSVRAGMTALPNAAADAAGGLAISDAGGLDLDAILVDTSSLNDTKIPNTLNTTVSGNIGIDWANVENPTTTLDLSGTDIQLCDTITTYTGDTPQTGDNFARLGAPAGASVSADIADVPTVAEFNARTLVSGSYFDPATDAVANVTLVATTTTNTDMRGTDSAATAAEMAKVPKSDGTASWNATALGAINAECDTALTDYDGPTNAEMVARTLATADYFDPAADTVANVTTVATNTDMRGTDSALLAASINLTAGAVDNVTTVATTTTNTDMVAAAPTVTDILTTQMTESYSADGAAPTLAQSLMLIQQSLGDFAISGTTITVRRVNGATTAATFTLDDATSPTSTTRAT